MLVRNAPRLASGSGVSRRSPFCSSAAAAAAATIAPATATATASRRHHRAHRAGRSHGRGAILDADPRELDRFDGRQRHRRLSRVSATAAPRPSPRCTTTNYTDNGLTAATAYTYAVRAVRCGDARRMCRRASGRRQRHHRRHRRRSAASTRRPANTTCLAGDPPSSTVSHRGAARVRQPAEFHAAHRHAPGARQFRALVRRAENRLRARVRQHAECLDDARVHQHRVAAQFESRQLQRRARPARHGVPSQLPDRSARLSSSTPAPTRRSASWTACRSSARATTAPRSTSAASSSCSTSMIRRAITTAATSPSAPTASSTSASATAAAATTSTAPSATASC